MFLPQQKKELLPKRFLFQDPDTDVEVPGSNPESAPEQAPENPREQLEEALRNRRLDQERIQRETLEFLHNNTELNDEQKETLRGRLRSALAEQAPQEGESFEDWVERQNDTGISELLEKAKLGNINLLQTLGLDWDELSAFSAESKGLADLLIKLGDFDSKEAWAEFRKWSEENPIQALITIVAGAYSLYKLTDKLFNTSKGQKVLMMLGGTFVFGKILGMEKVQDFMKKYYDLDLDDAALLKILERMADMEFGDAVKELGGMLKRGKKEEDAPSSQPTNRGTEHSPERLDRSNWLTVPEATAKCKDSIEEAVLPITAHIEAHPHMYAMIAALVGGRHLIDGVKGTMSFTKGGLESMAKLLRAGVDHPIRAAIVVLAFWHSREAMDAKVIPPNRQQLALYLREKLPEINEYIEDNHLGSPLREEQIETIAGLVSGELTLEDLGIAPDQLANIVIDSFQEASEVEVNERLHDRNTRGLGWFINALRQEIPTRSEEQQEYLDMLKDIKEALPDDGQLDASQLQRIREGATKVGVRIVLERGWLKWGFVNEEGAFLDPENLNTLGINPEASEEEQAEALQFFSPSSSLSSILPETARAFTERLRGDLSAALEELQKQDDFFIIVKDGAYYAVSESLGKYLEVGSAGLEALTGDYGVQEVLLAWGEGVAPALIIASPAALASGLWNRSLGSGVKVLFKAAAYPFTGPATFGYHVLRPFLRGMRQAEEGSRILEGLAELGRVSGGEWFSRMGTRSKYEILRRINRSGVDELRKLNAMKEALRQAREFQNKLTRPSVDEIRQIISYLRDSELQHLEELVDREDISRTVQNLRNALRQQEGVMRSNTQAISFMEQAAGSEVRTMLDNADEGLRSWMDDIPEEYRSFMNEAGDQARSAAAIESADQIRNAEQLQDALRRIQAGEAITGEEFSALKQAANGDALDDVFRAIGLSSEQAQSVNTVLKSSESPADMARSLQQAGFLRGSEAVQETSQATSSLLSGSREWMNASEAFENFDSFQGPKFSVEDIAQLTQQKNSAELTDLLKLKGVPEEKAAEIARTLSAVDSPEDVMQALRMGIGPEQVRFTPKVTKWMRSLRWAATGFTAFGEVAGVIGTVVSGVETGSSLYTAATTDDADRRNISLANAGLMGLNFGVDAYATYTFGTVLLGTAEAGAAVTAGALTLPLIPLTLVGSNIYEAAYERTKTVAEWGNSAGRDQLIHEWISTSADNAGDRLRDVYMDRAELDREKSETARRIMVAILNREEGRAIDAEPNQFRMRFLEAMGVEGPPADYHTALRILHSSRLFEEIMNIRENHKRYQQNHPQHQFKVNGVDLLEERFEQTDFETISVIFNAYQEASLEMLSPALERNFDHFSDAYLLDLWTNIEFAGKTGAQGLTMNHRLFAFQLENYLKFRRDIDLQRAFALFMVALKDKSEEERVSIAQAALQAVDQYQNNPTESLAEDLRKTTLTKHVNALYAAAQFFGYSGHAKTEDLKAFFSQDSAGRHGVYWSEGNGWYMNDEGGMDDFMGQELTESTIRAIINEFKNDDSDNFDTRNASVLDMTTINVAGVDTQRKVFRAQSRALGLRMERAWEQEVVSFQTLSPASAQIRGRNSSEPSQPNAEKRGSEGIGSGGTGNEAPQESPK